MYESGVLTIAADLVTKMVRRMGVCKEELKLVFKYIATAKE
jgi:hypothetical protein